MTVGTALATDIEIGHHVTKTIGGFTFNVDTIWCTVIAGGLVILLGLLARRAMTKKTEDHVPTKLQLFWEFIVTEVQNQVRDNMGRLHPLVVPMATALFLFILFSNWLELIPSEPNGVHLLPAPTADVNVTYPLAILVMVCVWVYAVRNQGLLGFGRHLMQPFKIMLPLNLLDEVLRPVTLALRLFGNIFAGGIMITLIGLLPNYVLWLPSIIWKLFDMFIGGVQAFIFALLTVVYFGMATGHADEHVTAQPESPTQPQPAH